ncbi:MAG: class I tRNA ligase family protein, partial [Phycisphaerae bacterium]|nr:class I tRNA ligase family protein [Phycisphaerae bacterium]
GCVHTAPGHGREDFITGQRYGLEPLSPVDPAGRLTEAAGVCVGQKVFEADPNIVKLLEEKGALLASAPVKHSYPHCWRCHEPVIFRSTEQWFVNVEHEDLRNRLIAEVDRVKWIPDWGRSRMLGMLTSRPDWCISRQRSWGVPIPAFYCVGCGETVLTADSVRHVRDLFGQHGSDHWFTHEAAELAPPGLKCPKCGGSTFEKENDIFDVWFESGSSHWSVVKQDSRLNWPADLYLEGSDQHRGWFQVSMITGMCAKNDAPFEAVLTHGFVMDDKGQKMSKSKGNYISTEDATKAVGADIFRLWVASANFRDDINTSIALMRKAGENYRKIRNTIKFILGNLFDFDPAANAVAPADMPVMDRWAVTQANKLHRDCVAFYDDYLFHRVYGELFAFCDTTLSAFYLDSLKDRLYCDGRDSLSRRSAQTAICHCLGQIIQLLAPICPFTAEEAFAALPRKTGQFAEAESVHLLTMQPPPGDWDDPKLAEHFDRLFKIRTDVLVQLESLRKAKAIGGGGDARVSLHSADAEVREFLTRHAGMLPAFFNVSEVVVAASADGLTPGTAEPKVAVRAEASPSPKCDRCWKHLPTVGADATQPTLCERCAAAVKARE